MKLMEKLQSIDELERQLEHVRNSKGLDGIDTQSSRRYWVMRPGRM